MEGQSFECVDPLYFSVLLYLDTTELEVVLISSTVEKTTKGVKVQDRRDTIECEHVQKKEEINMPTRTTNNQKKRKGEGNALKRRKTGKSLFSGPKDASGPIGEEGPA